MSKVIGRQASIIEHFEKRIQVNLWEEVLDIIITIIIFIVVVITMGATNQTFGCAPVKCYCGGSNQLRKVYALPKMNEKTMGKRNEITIRYL